MERPKIIAELCCNHMGDLGFAKRMIREAAEHGADIVKFQKRDIDEWVKRKPEVYKKPHPNPAHAFGSTYEEHRRNLEFSFEQHRELKEYCDSLGVNYSSSVFDIKSAKEICSLKPKMVKIASACNQNFEMLDWICENYEGDIHLSVGMTTYEEIDNIIDYFEKKGRNKNLVVYACTSGYPVMPKDVCLLEISRLKERYGSRIKAVGFSGHHFGITLDLAAFTLGAEYIERHFTLNKSLKGTDQIASILPDELHVLTERLDEIAQALEYKNGLILDVEKGNKEKLKW